MRSGLLVVKIRAASQTRAGLGDVVNVGVAPDLKQNVSTLKSL